MVWVIRRQDGTLLEVDGGLLLFDTEAKANQLADAYRRRWSESATVEVASPPADGITGCRPGVEGGRRDDGGEKQWRRTVSSKIHVTADDLPRDATAPLTRAKTPDRPTDRWALRRRDGNMLSWWHRSAWVHRAERHLFETREEALMERDSWLHQGHVHSALTVVRIRHVPSARLRAAEQHIAALRAYVEWKGGCMHHPEDCPREAAFCQLVQAVNDTQKAYDAVAGEKARGT